jgi:Type ISP C-terminal specificity domain/N-6 DNA Methylase
MKTTLSDVISTFGSSAKAKLSNPVVTGQPEDQLRAPFEQLLQGLAELANLPAGSVTAVGESTLLDLKTRPDYSITVHGALVGFVELKAPGKGADPRKFKDPHDKAQWERLRSLPNLLYTDGNSFSLWQNGELYDKILTLDGDVETSGPDLSPPSGFANLFEAFLLWAPVAPSSAKDLAQTAARLCRLLRDEVTEQLELKSEALTDLATDWRKLLFPDATNERFADGYAQAVTFGMLMARAKGISLATGLQQVAAKLSVSSSLIGAALRLLTESPENQKTLKTALGTLTRVLDAVDWNKISKGKPDAWLYFYEEFLDVYDRSLRKKTGSYYTPPEVVNAMVGLVDEVLRSNRFQLHRGLAAPSVTLVDPATGTGTYMLSVLRKIADTIRMDEGPGAVSENITNALKRLIAFEMQLGPFAVAQLRILAEIVDLTTSASTVPLRMFVTDTLGDPYDDAEWIPGTLAALGKSRKDANKIKREETVTVVIGNPPYKNAAKGKGGWVEKKSANAKAPAPLEAWIPPASWGISAHSKHLRNLYVYFWRWATWKVFDQKPNENTGIVSFITVSGFLAGPGFQRMREYLRKTCQDIWIIDCSPEGHQPEVNTRIFQGVQQPICIVMVARSSKISQVPGTVHFRSLLGGRRQDKFAALGKISIADKDWIDCPSDPRAPFLPVSLNAWATYPLLEELFIYNGSGVMPGRTWIIAPDTATLEARWKKLVESPKENKEKLFHPHLRGGQLGDKHSQKLVKTPLHGFTPTTVSVAEATGAMKDLPVPYGFRSFDRQWIVPDSRLINQPNPELWKMRSPKQLFLTALSRTSPTSGPALTITGDIPDLDHYKGSFGGRVYPLWQDDLASNSNFRKGFLKLYQEKLGIPMSPEDMFSYVAALLASPGYTARFKLDLSTPGLRIPLTADPVLFEETVKLGRRFLWLYSFGERMSDPADHRPAGSPRVLTDPPTIPKDGGISGKPEEMPDVLGYDANKQRLLVGHGFIDNVSPAVWRYEVSGKQILVQWFSYRKKNRERPLIGERRTPSALGDIQPNHWLAEYTTDLLNLLNVLTLLVELEPAQVNLLEKVCTGPLVTHTELETAGAFAKAVPLKKSKASKKVKSGKLFSSV